MEENKNELDTQAEVKVDEAETKPAEEVEAKPIEEVKETEASEPVATEAEAEITEEEIIKDAEDFRDGKMTIGKLKTNPKEVEGDRALLVSALHALYSSKSTKEELDKAVADLKEAASHDDVYANTLLGVLYAEGGEATPVDTHRE